MTWTKLDDQFDGHPKVVKAWETDPVSIGLHTLALSHSAAYLTDGHVSPAFVKSKLPTPARRRRVVAALVDAGLWETNGSGWVIHDYLDFNESREEVMERRDRDLVRKKSTRNPGGIRASRVRARPHGPTPTPFP